MLARNNLFLVGELHRVKLEVAAPPLQQLLVGALLHNLASVHHNHLVSVLNGGQAVSDHKTRPSLHEHFQCLLNLLFRFGIYTGCSLIKHENARVGDECPRE